MPNSSLKILSIFLPVIAGSLFFAGNLPAEEQLQLRVLCYNIHYGQGMDGKYDIARLAKVIAKQKPDIVALQEIDVGVKRSGLVHQARELGKLTGMQVRFGPTQHYEGGLFGNGVLTNFPIRDVHIQPLPYTASTPEKTTYPRGAIATILELPNGRELKFISTHFQHNMAEDRVQEAKAINRYFVDDQLPAILAGDMNATPEAEPIQILQSQWKNAMNAAQTPSAPSVNPRSRIDYIFFRGTSLKMVHTEVIAEQMASDHRPVLAVFEFAE